MFTSFSCRLFAQLHKQVGDDGYVYYEIETPKGKAIKNELGDVIVPPTHGYIYYEKGFFVISRLDIYAAYDKKGRNIIPFTREYSFIFIDDYSDGLKYIKFRKGSKKSGYKYGVCDLNGNEVISAEKGYDYIHLNQEDGIPFFKVKKGRKYGVCNGAGEEITPPIHKYVRLGKANKVHKKIFEVKITDAAYRYDTDKFSYGKKVSFPIYTKYEGAHGNEEFSWYEIKPNGFGAKDKSGKILVPEDYVINSFKDGFFYVKKDGYEGIYDKTGECLIPTNRQYHGIYKWEFEDRTAFICIRTIGKDKTIKGVCDANGKELISPDRGYTSVLCRAQKGIPYFKVERGKKEGLCNASGKEIVSPKYKFVYVPDDGTIEGDNRNLYLSLNDDVFKYDKKSIYFGEDKVQSINYLTRTDITKELSTESIAGFKYYRFSKDGRCGALSTEGKLIIPPHYKFITFDDFSDALLAIKEDGTQAMYTKSGQELIPVSRGYTFIMRWDEDGYGPYYQVEMGKGNIGLCDASGTEIIPPTRGYTDISLSNYKSTWFTIVQKDGKYGACTASGREIVQPIYDDLAIREDQGTFVGKTSSGNTIDLKVKPNGYKVQERNYQAEEERKARRRANRQRWLSALAAGFAGAANAYANVIAQQAARQNVSSYTPSISASNYSGSSSYATSPAYLAQVQARANRSMANYQAQLRSIGQQALANNQQMMKRSQEMFTEKIKWSFKFRNENGREATELEQMQWVQQNYPDMYDIYVQSMASQYEHSSGNADSESENVKETKTISNTTDCSFCGGKGRLLQEDETLSFGLSVEKEYKCNECGKWKIKGKTHRHYDCSHCKGKGKVTYN